MPITAGELAARLGGEVTGDSSLSLTGVATPEAAGPGDLIYVESEKRLPAAQESRALVVIAGKGAALTGKTIICVENPKQSFARAVEILLPEPPVAVGVHSTAAVDESAEVHASVAVGAQAVIGASAKIGEGTQVGPGCVVGAGVEIGKDCVLFPRVVVYPGAKLCDRVRLHAGVVIGSDGFGYIPTEESWEKFPQRGKIVIEDDVEIGANSAIDRATLGETRIGRGVKIDNLVHIAHNVSVGEHSVLAALTGIAGSTTLGRKVVAGGQAGVADHCTIEDGAQLAGNVSVQTGKTIRAGEVVFGNPARPLAEFKKSFAHFIRLPELARRVKALEKKIKG